MATTTASEAGRSGTADDVRDVVESALAAIGRAGTTSATNLADAVEGAGRSLTRRVVTGALEAPRPLRDRDALTNALAERPAAPLLASATGAALAVRALSRVPALTFLSRRTPMWLVAAAVPALVASVSRGADELSMVSSHLTQRARAAGVEPDPERLRRVSVQILSGAPVDPDAEPRHGPLVIAWLKRAFRAALPYTAGVATRDPEGLATVAADVDPKLLAP
jgi:hypothetical protein